MKETLQYDALGNVTASEVTTDTSAAAARTTAEYDGQSQLLSQTDLRGVEVSIDYDSQGNVTAVGDSLDAPSGVTYVYNTSSALTQMGYSAGPGYLINFGFDSAKRPNSISALDGTLTTNIEYDATAKVTTLTTSYGGQGLANYHYLYDERGNIAQATEPSGTTSYGYDVLGRLTSVINAGSSTIGYQYDDLGNRLTKASSAEGTTTYEYDESNQLTGEARPSGEIVTYSYDENGNLVLESSSVNGITSYSYDAKNRLARVTKPSGDEVAFVYDGNGNRYEKRSIPASGTPTSTFYAYDGAGNIFLEYSAAQTFTVRYIRDPNGKALAMDNNGTMYWFIYNEHGDVVKVIDSSGTTAASYSYDEFGNLKSSTGTLYNPIRYSGASNAYFDSETGLYKMGARYYKPEIGRWITRDSFEGLPDQPQSQNKYAYTENDPIDHVDPSGNWTQRTLAYPYSRADDTVRLVEVLRVNGGRARAARRYFAGQGGWQGLQGGWGKLLWTYTMFKPGGPWDLKLAPPSVPLKSDFLKFRVDGHECKISKEDFGNMHYGYEGAVLQYPRRFLNGVATALPVAGALGHWPPSCTEAWKQYFHELRDRQKVNLGYRLSWIYGARNAGYFYVRPQAASAW